ncbi:PBSX family phage terminase large subunit [Marispirochaeta aestuarii]|uniref:PBSX family phage terminase large subunit n=1 Tax=Marispirochaeta aestuarii TaxID=1963862 RepID=UPI0029C692C1|nr:PBSX family phage terminase large subunit [Marispirochaeta aestuarii]
MANVEALKRRLDKAAGILGEATLRPIFHLHTEEGSPLRYVNIQGGKIPKMEPQDVPFTMIERMFNDLTSGKRFTILEGGRGSGKSYGVASYLIARALIKPERVLCCREVQVSIVQSSKSLLEKIIRSDARLLDFFEIQRDVIIGRNGSEFLFRGVRDYSVDAIRSFESISICWPEESQNLTRKSWDILVPTVRVEGSQFFVTMNRKSINDAIYKEFIEQKHPEARVGKYLLWENPWASETLKRDAEILKTTNFSRWDHVYNGQIESLSDVRIFDNFIVRDFDIEDVVKRRIDTMRIGTFGTRRERAQRWEEAKARIDADFHIGVDFGFIDPTVSLLVYKATEARELFILDEIYKTDLDVSGIAREIRQFLQRNNREGWPFYCDSARPEIVAELKNRYGLNAHSVRKHRIKDGIDILKGWRIWILPHCENCIRELGLYSWKVNQNGDPLPEPAPGHDHCPDALRYSVISEITSSTGEYEILKGW